MLNQELSESQRIIPNVEEAASILSNNFLNQLTKTNVYAYYLTYSLLILYFSYNLFFSYSLMASLALICSGIVIWSLVEYIVHRHVFHLTSSNRILKLIIFISHGVHHAYPQDVSRSITPLVISLPLATMFYFIFKLLFSTYAGGIFTGFLLGYFLYTIIHDSTHHFPMNYPVLKQLKRHHLRHHYFDDNKNFGVSHAFWDLAFNTYAKTQQIKKSH